jgi:hypothetical protein
MAKDFSEMVFSRDLNAPVVKRGLLPLANGIRCK